MCDHARRVKDALTAHGWKYERVEDSDLDLELWVNAATAGSVIVQNRGLTAKAADRLLRDCGIPTP